MARTRKRPNNPFIQQLLDERGLTELRELAAQLGLPETSIHKFANLDPEGDSYKGLRGLAEATGKPLAEVVVGLLGGAKRAS